MRDPEVAEPGVRVPPSAAEVRWGQAVGIRGLTRRRRPQDAVTPSRRMSSASDIECGSGVFMDNGDYPSNREEAGMGDGRHRHLGGRGFIRIAIRASLGMMHRV